MLNVSDWPLIHSKCEVFQWIASYHTHTQRLAESATGKQQCHKYRKTLWIWLLFIHSFIWRRWFLCTETLIHLWFGNLASRTQSNWLLMHDCLKLVLHKDDFARCFFFSRCYFHCLCVNWKAPVAQWTESVSRTYYTHTRNHCDMHRFTDRFR